MRPAIGRMKPLIVFERRGLAAAVRSQQGHDLAASDGEVDAAQDLDLPVPGHEALDGKQRRGDISGQGRPSSTSRFRGTSAGVPSAMTLRRETTIRSDTVMTNSIACSMRTTAIPSSRTSRRMTPAAARGRRRQPDGRLVEEKEGRARGQRAHDLDHPLLPARQLAGRLSARWPMPISSRSPRARLVAARSVARAAGMPNRTPKNPVGTCVWRPASTFSSRGQARRRDRRSEKVRRTPFADTR